MFDQVEFRHCIGFAVMEYNVSFPIVDVAMLGPSGVVRYVIDHDVVGRDDCLRGLWTDEALYEQSTALCGAPG